MIFQIKQMGTQPKRTIFNKKEKKPEIKGK